MKLYPCVHLGYGSGIKSVLEKIGGLVVLETDLVIRRFGSGVDALVRYLMVQELIL